MFERRGQVVNRALCQKKKGALPAQEMIEGKGGGMQNKRSNSLQIEDYPIFGRHAFSRQKRSYNIIFVHADKCLQRDMERKCKSSNGVKNAMHDLHNSSVKRRGRWCLN